MNTVTKEVQLNDVVFVVEIREIDFKSFSSQQIAVAKSYASALNKCKDEMIKIMAWNKDCKDLDAMKLVWGRAFR